MIRCATCSLLRPSSNIRSRPWVRPEKDNASRNNSVISSKLFSSPSHRPCVLRGFRKIQCPGSSPNNSRTSAMSVARHGQFTAMASFNACGLPSLWLGNANKSHAHILSTHSALLNPFISMHTTSPYLSPPSTGIHSFFESETLFCCEAFFVEESDRCNSLASVESDWQLGCKESCSLAD